MNGPHGPNGPNEPDAFAEYDAAYVLGALSPQDQSDYEAHLSACPDCSRAVRELAGMPGLLGQAQAVPVASEPPPGDLLPALIGRVTAARRRRRLLTRLTTAGVALAACLALLLTLFLPVGQNDDGDRDGDGNGPTPIAMTSLVRYPVEATVSLAENAGGTRVTMECLYGIEDANEYVLVAITRDGGSERLASWFTMPDEDVRMSVATGLRREDIAALEVRSTHGYTALRAELPGSA
jgi:putative zinc finger protein